MGKIFNGDYYIGLDVGTSSVGWAVSDALYNIPNFNGKAMWGVNLFDEANTAEDRRTNRGARRRGERKKHRLKLLECIFADAMAAVDPEFFLRLANSPYYEEDKDVTGKYGFFNDPEYNDATYLRKYPTIYHLREELMSSKEPHDIRLVFLAIHHIIKNRGHFVIQGDFSAEKGWELPPLLKSFIATVGNLFDFEIRLKDEKAIGKIIASDKKSSEKEAELKKLVESVATGDKTIDSINKKIANTICKLMAGGKTSLATLYNDVDLKEVDKKDVALSSNYDEEWDSYYSILGEKIQLIDDVKAIYDWGVLKRLLKGEKSISQAKIASYEQHREDKQALKAALKVLYKGDEYKKIKALIFGNPEGPERNKKATKKKDKTYFNNYSAYVGTYFIKGEDSADNPNFVKCSQEKFLEFLIDILELKNKGKKEKEYVSEFQQKFPELYSKIMNGTIFPKQRIKDNCTIPYQLNKMELEKILENVGAYLPFIKDRDESGYSNEEKIMKLLTFRIPYYVGPINTNNSKNAWAVRKVKDVKVYPWNMEEVIDYEESAQRFIRRMTNKCSYIPTEDVLPKNSILYSKFTVLNEINNININGKRLPVEVKQEIYKQVFLKNKNVTRKRIKNYLLKQGYIKADDLEGKDIEGVDEKCTSTMASYIDFAKILNEGKELNEEQIALAEQCIVDIVLFGADKHMLKKRLKALLGSKVSEAQFNKIVNLKYSGWGRLSEYFLKNIKVEVETKENTMSIIDGLYFLPANPNLMQLLSNDYGFSKAIDKYNAEFIKDKSLEEVLADAYVSPSVKRAIHKSIGVVKELCSILGKAPKKIFIEMARGGEQIKQRTESRKSTLDKLYKDIIKQKDKLFTKEEITTLQKAFNGKTDNELRGDKLFLYYLQMGRCMYTGEKIELSKLNSDYDIDHIYPRSYVKDDSLNNRVLVKKNINLDKSDEYPLKESIRNNPKVRALWDYLLASKLMDKEKYYRLTRNTRFTLGELEGFINRQLVETRQSTKALAQILQMALPNTRIVYVKAGNVSDFRHGVNDLAFDETTTKQRIVSVNQRETMNKMLKFRDINDFHHAKDAYLNIVVGNVYNTKFTDNPRNFIEKKEQGAKRPYSLNTMYRKTVKNAWEPTTVLEDGTVVEGTVKTVKKYMKRNNPQVVKSTVERSGQLFNLTVLKKGLGEGRVPRKLNSKLSDISKYGSYNSVNIAYFFVVEHGGSEREVTIESMPIMYKQKINSKEDLLKYCAEECGLINPRILIAKLKPNSIFIYKGFRFVISGKSKDYIVIKNANQFIVDNKYYNYLKVVQKENSRIIDKLQSTINDRANITKEMNLEIYRYFKTKMKKAPYAAFYEERVAKVDGFEEAFTNLSIEDQCNILIEFLSLFNCSENVPNFKKIGGAEKFGILQLSKKITDKIKDLLYINASPTGLFETIYRMEDL